VLKKGFITKAIKFFWNRIMIEVGSPDVGEIAILSYVGVTKQG
jgi:hypothetical protein